MMAVEQFLLKWNNHQSNFVDVFGQLYDQEAFTDVTLAADGKTFEAHKIVLSACSPYLRHILSQNPCRHPVVILRGVSCSQLHTLLQYIYRGETHVSQNQLADLLRTASDLQIKGLASVVDSGNSSSGVSSERCESPAVCGAQLSTNVLTDAFPSPPLSTPSKTPAAAAGELVASGGSTRTAAARLDLSSPPPPSSSTASSSQSQAMSAVCAVSPVTAADNKTAIFNKNDGELSAGFSAGDTARDLVTDMASVSVGTTSDSLAPLLSTTTIKCESESHSFGITADQAVAGGSGQQFSGGESGGGVAHMKSVSDDSTRCSLPATVLRRFQSLAKKGPYKCRFCGETFKAKEHLNRHERIHTGERPFPCSLCGKRFSRKDHLKIHLLIHTGEKPFQCSMCNKRFTQKQTLIEHENVHLGRRPFNCDLCDAAFPARGNLKYHRRSVHGCTLSGARAGVAASTPTTVDGSSAVRRQLLQLQLNQQLLAAAAAAAAATSAQSADSSVAGKSEHSEATAAPPTTVADT